VDSGTTALQNGACNYIGALPNKCTTKQPFQTTTTVHEKSGNL
jgi:hypothetical protein